MASKRVYVAVSGFGGEATESILTMATGPRGVAELLADQEIDRQYPDRTDIHNDTLKKNLRIVPLGQLERTAHGRWMLEGYLDRQAEEA